MTPIVTPAVVVLPSRLWDLRPGQLGTRLLDRSPTLLLSIAEDTPPALNLEWRLLRGVLPWIAPTVTTYGRPYEEP